MLEELTERARGLGRREVAGVLALAVLILGGIAFWYVRSLPRPITVASHTGGPADMPASPSTAASEAPPVVVYVSGWVVDPGVYEFRQGDRIIDALDRAGGPRKGANLTIVNLAAPLVDGQQIVIAKAGTSGPVSEPPVSSSTDPTGGQDELINLNTATVDQLETLPGIGEVLAQRIIDYRDENGPFESVADLPDVSGIVDARMADLETRVTV